MMELYPVPSLQFQSALKIATSIVCHPSVVKSPASTHFERICNLFLKADRMFFLRDNETSWTEILVDLSLPHIIENYVSRILHHVLKQVYDFILEAEPVIRHAPCSHFPLKNVEELVRCLYWTSDGLIDMNQTVDSMKTLISELFISARKSVCSKCIILCSYLLDGYHFNIRQHNDSVENSYGHDFNIRQYNDSMIVSSHSFKNYIKDSHDFRQRLPLLALDVTYVRHLFELKDFAMLKICWTKLLRLLRSSKSSVDVIFKCFFDALPVRTYYGWYVTHARNIRHCLMQFDELEQTTLFQQCASKGIEWIKLLLTFKSLPDKTLFWDLMKQVSETLKTDTLISFVEAFRYWNCPESFESKNYGRVTLSLLFQDVWNHCNSECKNKFLSCDDGVCGLLRWGPFCRRIIVTVLLKYFCCNNNQHYLNCYKEEIFWTIIRFELTDIEAISHDFPELGFKEMMKEFLWTEDYYGHICFYGMHRVKKYIRLSGFMPDDIEKFKRKVYSHIFAKDDYDYKSYYPYSVLAFIDWCVVDKKDRRRLKKLIDIKNMCYDSDYDSDNDCYYERAYEVSWRKYDRLLMN